MWHLGLPRRLAWARASRRKILICRPSGAADESAGAWKVMALAQQAFRRPVTPPTRRFDGCIARVP
jgi:hypothetical protein